MEGKKGHAGVNSSKSNLLEGTKQDRLKQIPVVILSSALHFVWLLHMQQICRKGKKYNQIEKTDQYLEAKKLRYAIHPILCS